MLSWGLLVILCLGLGLFWFWQDSLAVRERANAAAIEACEKLGLQFLDGTVAFARLRVTRGDTGRVQLRRTYVFDYTANSIERRQGFVELLGRRVESTGFASEPAPRALSLPREESPPEPPSTSAPSNVYALDEWRRRRLAQQGRRSESGGNSQDRSHDA